MGLGQLGRRGDGSRKFFRPATSGGMTGTKRRRMVVLAGVASVGLLAAGMSTAQALTSSNSSTSYRLLVSSSADKGAAKPLSGATINGSQYIYVGPSNPNRVDRVTFRLDGRYVPGSAEVDSIDWYAPWDLMGGDGASTKPLDLSQLPRGAHTITATLKMYGRSNIVLSARFINGATTTPTTSTTPTTTVPTTAVPTTPVPTTKPSTTQAPTTQIPTTIRPTTTTPTTTSPATTVPQKGRTYPLHTNIVATTFWVGEIFDPTLPDGSQVCSTYDAQWAYHWSGINKGSVPASAGGCQGSIVGGCDGIAAPNKCDTEKRTAANGYFPTQATPKENPFYLDLPFDDLNDSTGFSTRCSVIPWANDPGYAGHCNDSNFSYMKNKWVKMTGPNGNTCYGQVQDAGPSHGSLYHDAAYVFGSNNARPVQGQFNNAGADVSPALNGCLGFSELDGQSDRISWSFVDAVDVPAGPWTRVVTTSGVTN